MKVSKEVVMNLAVKDGEIALVIEPTTVKTKAEAIMLATAIRKLANNLPEYRARAKPPAKRTSSRPTAKPRPNRSQSPRRRNTADDAAAADTSAE